MKVTGFTFIKNAVLYQYPIVEAIQSILPLCDEVVVSVGDSNDGTKELVQTIHPDKIKIIDTLWDDQLLKGGEVLAAETNKAFRAIGDESDWCIYIQGDEVMHEDGYDEVRYAMGKWKGDEKVDGLLFNYRHFYGSYDYVGVASHWYRNEIRVIKNNKKIYSYKDAQGFRKGQNEKLNVKKLDGYIHHYGWVREPHAMQNKLNNFGGLYHGKEWTEKRMTTFSGDFDYSKIDALEKFTGRHPAVMQQRIQKMNWTFDHDLSYNKIKWKDRFKNGWEKLTGKRPFDHNNFRII